MRVYLGMMLALVLAAQPVQARILPIIFYTPDTGFGAGGFIVKNLDEPATGDPSQLVGFITGTQRKQVISIVEPKIYWDGGLWEWTGKISAQDFPSDYYGRETLELDAEDAELYRDKRWGLETSLKNIFHERYFWMVRAESGWQRYDEDHEDDPTPNVDAEFERWGLKSKQQSLTLALGRDSRNSKVRPTEGHLLQVFYRGQRFQTDGGSDSFGLSGFDGKQYVSLGDRQSLALQLYAAAMDREEVPFYMLLGMGGNQVLRGFYGNQFRDYAIAFAQSEWRTLWRQDFGFRVFAGVGGHASTLADLDDAQGKAAGGFGFDYFLDRKSMTNLRLDFGLSADNFGVYFLYGNAI